MIEKTKQFLQFSAVGVLNTAIDIGVLSVLVLIFGLHWSLFAYPILKSASFLLALANSYFWNKHWVFRHGDMDVTGREMMTFTMISIGGLILNTLISSFVYTMAVSAYGHLSNIILANAAAIVGTCFVLVWNFIGYKLLVFKR